MQQIKYQWIVKAQENIIITFIGPSEFRKGYECFDAALVLTTRKDSSHFFSF